MTLNNTVVFVTPCICGVRMTQDDAKKMRMCSECLNVFNVQYTNLFLRLIDTIYTFRHYATFYYILNMSEPITFYNLIGPWILLLIGDLIFEYIFLTRYSVVLNYNRVLNWKFLDFYIQLTTIIANVNAMVIANHIVFKILFDFNDFSRYVQKIYSYSLSKHINVIFNNVLLKTVRLGAFIVVNYVFIIYGLRLRSSEKILFVISILLFLFYE